MQLNPLTFIDIAAISRNTGMWSAWHRLCITESEDDYMETGQVGIYLFKISVIVVHYINLICNPRHIGILIKFLPSTMAQDRFERDTQDAAQYKC